MNNIWVESDLHQFALFARSGSKAQKKEYREKLAATLDILNDMSEDQQKAVAILVEQKYAAGYDEGQQSYTDW